MSDNFFKTPLGVIITFLAMVGVVAICSNPWWFHNTMQMISTILAIIFTLVMIVYWTKRI